MPSNSSSGSGAAMPPGADDFTRIRGISPKIAGRFYESGILTFAKLAAMSPDEIIARIGVSSGVSAESIARKDWIGQARELAPQSAPVNRRAEPDAEPDAEPSGQQRADFAVALWINHDGAVSRAHVMHMQSGAEDEWTSWQATQLVDFFVQRAALSLPPVESSAPAEPPPSAAMTDQTLLPTAGSAPPPAATSAPASLLAAASAPVGEPRLREMETIPAHAAQPSWMLSAGQPFGVRLTLDLTEVKSPEGAPLNYTAEVYAKSLEGRGRQPVGESQGSLTPAGEIVLNVQGSPLPRGLYSLQAVVNLEPSRPGPRPQPNLITQLGGKLLQVR